MNLRKLRLNYWLLFFVSVIVIAFGMEANAAIIHVPGDYPTIQEGINAAQPGDTVQVAAGTYTETLNMKESVIIQGAGADVTIIEGGDGVFAWGIGEGKLDGFTVRNSNLTGIHCYTTSVTFSNNVIINNNHTGIGCFDDLANPVIINNAIIGNGGDGIRCDGASHPKIMNNIIGGNRGEAIGLYGSSSPNIINNTVIKNADGIDCEDSSQPTIMNNIVVNNCGSGIDVDDGAAPVVGYNNVWGNGEDYENLEPGIGDISVDPLFIDPEAGNYQLQDGSPCIDAGNPAAKYNDLHFPPSKGTERNDMGLYGGPNAVELPFTIPQIKLPALVDWWVESINLSPSMAEIYGGDVWMDIAIEGCRVASAEAISPSAVSYTLYNDGTHGDLEADDEEWAYMPIVPDIMEMGEWTLRVITPEGEIFEETDGLGENTMPIPELLYPADEIVASTTPTLRWKGLWMAEEYWVVIWDRLPDLAGRLGDGLLFDEETEETQIAIPPGILQPGSTYYWAVLAEADPEHYECQAAMEMSSFKVDAQAWMQVNEDGFGDPNNIFIRSMGEFDSYLEAGTFNEITGCEAWRYDGDSWVQFNIDGFGDVNNIGIGSGSVFGENLYLGTQNEVTGCEVWKYDGATWTQVNEDGFADPNNIRAAFMGVYDGDLYVGTQNEVAGCEVWKYDGATWTQVNEDGFADPNNFKVFSGAVFNGNVYVGTCNKATSTEIWMYDGVNWTQANEDGFGDPNNNKGSASMAVFGNNLYVGTGSGHPEATGCEVWRYDGVDWTQVNEDGFGDANNFGALSMTVFGDNLYVGTGKRPEATGCEVWLYDGDTWTQVNTDGFGDPNNKRAFSMATFDGNLYVGTRNEPGGCEVWQMKGIIPDIKANGSDGPITISTSDTLSITIELDPGIYPGVPADWWCVTDAPFGWYYYDDTGTWLPGFYVSYQGPLFTLTPPLEVLNISDLPIGGYTFYFGVDGNRNGNLDEPLYHDSVNVNITP